MRFTKCDGFIIKSVVCFKLGQYNAKIVNGSKLLSIFTKRFILDVLESSQYLFGIYFKISKDNLVQHTFQ